MRARMDLPADWLALELPKAVLVSAGAFPSPDGSIGVGVVYALKTLKG